MTNENLIHVGYEYEEAVEAKKNLLDLQINLLESVKALKHYHSLRAEELKLRLRLYLRTKEAMAKLKKLKKNLPTIEQTKQIIPKEKKKEDVPKILNKKAPVKKEQPELQYSNEVDTQLQKIREKLASLKTK